MLLFKQCCSQVALCKGEFQNQVTLFKNYPSCLDLKVAHRARWSWSRGTGTGRPHWTWLPSTATRTSSSSLRARRGGGTHSCPSSLTSGVLPFVTETCFHRLFPGLWSLGRADELVDLFSFSSAAFFSGRIPCTSSGWV